MSQNNREKLENLLDLDHVRNFRGLMAQLCKEGNEGDAVIVKNTDSGAFVSTNSSAVKEEIELSEDEFFDIERLWKLEADELQTKTEEYSMEVLEEPGKPEQGRYKCEWDLKKSENNQYEWVLMTRKGVKRPHLIFPTEWLKRANNLKILDEDRDPLWKVNLKRSSFSGHEIVALGLISLFVASGITYFAVPFQDFFSYVFTFLTVVVGTGVFFLLDSWLQNYWPQTVLEFNSISDDRRLLVKQFGVYHPFAHHFEVTLNDELIGIVKFDKSPYKGPITQGSVESLNGQDTVSFVNQLGGSVFQSLKFFFLGLLGKSPFSGRQNFVFKEEQREVAVFGPNSDVELIFEPKDPTSDILDSPLFLGATGVIATHFSIDQASHRIINRKGTQGD